MPIALTIAMRSAILTRVRSVDEFIEGFLDRLHEQGAEKSVWLRR